MAKDYDRHSWSGSSLRLTASRLHYHLPDFVLPIRILKLDPADRAVLRVAGRLTLSPVLGSDRRSGSDRISLSLTLTLSLTLSDLNLTIFLQFVA